MKKPLVLMLSAGLMPLTASAQTSPDVASYHIPADAVTLKVRYVDNPAIYYHEKTVDGSEGALLAVELYHGEQLVKRELFKSDPTKKSLQDCKYGVWREWYDNSQLKSEEPFRMGQRDGLFKYWDEKGQLIGQYQMTDGTGIMKMYTSEGKLVREQHYKNDQLDGFSFEFSPSALYKFSTHKNGRRIGMAFTFKDDLITDLSFNNAEGERHGLQITFDYRTPEEKKKPVVSLLQMMLNDNKAWSIHDQLVSEEKYAKATATDKTLPAYYKEDEKYKEFVTPEISALNEKYRTMPRVKIPLEFDAAGEPVLATTPPTPK